MSNTSFLNCCPAREREGKLWTLPLPPLAPRVSPETALLKSAPNSYSQLPSSVAINCQLWSCTLQELFALRSHKISQLLPYSYFIHTCTHTPGAFTSLVLCDSDTRSKLLPVIAHSNRQRTPSPNAMLHQEGSDKSFSNQLRGNYVS